MPMIFGICQTAMKDSGNCLQKDLPELMIFFRIRKKEFFNSEKCFLLYGLFWYYVSVPIKYFIKIRFPVLQIQIIGWRNKYSWSSLFNISSSEWIKIVGVADYRSLKEVPFRRDAYKQFGRNLYFELRIFLW